MSNGPSWANPVKGEMNLVGQIFFDTNDVVPKSPDDIQALEKLSEAYKPYLNSGFSLFFIGWADWRPTSRQGGNQQLSSDRALNTEDALFQLWQQELLNIQKVKSRCVGMGVDPVSQAFPPKDTVLQGYRRVDIISNIIEPEKPKPKPRPDQLNNDWKLKMTNITQFGVTTGVVGAIKELFNAEIENLKTGESLFFNFSGEGLNLGVPIPEVPFTSSYTRNVEASFRTVYGHTLEEFEGRQAHASTIVLLAPGLIMSMDLVFLNVKGLVRREDVTIRIGPSSSTTLGIPASSSIVTGDLIKK